MARRFSLAEAQSLIPRVDTLLREAVSLKSDYQEAEQVIQTMAQRVSMMGGMIVDRDQAIDARDRRDGVATKLRAAIEQVQEFGCVIKDLDTGLIDFPTPVSYTHLIRHGRKDIAEQLMKLRAPTGFTEDKLDLGGRLLLAEGDEAKCLQLINDAALKSLQSEDFEELMGFAYGRCV